MDSFGKAVFRHLISMQWLGLVPCVFALAGTPNSLEIKQNQGTQDRHRQLPEGEGEVHVTQAPQPPPPTTIVCFLNKRPRRSRVGL